MDGRHNDSKVIWGRKCGQEGAGHNWRPQWELEGRGELAEEETGNVHKELPTPSTMKLLVGKIIPRMLCMAAEKPSCSWQVSGLGSLGFVLRWQPLEQKTSNDISRVFWVTIHWILKSVQVQLWGIAQGQSCCKHGHFTIRKWTGSLPQSNKT